MREESCLGQGLSSGRGAHLDQPSGRGAQSSSLAGPEEKPDTGEIPVRKHRWEARSGKQRRTIGAQAKPGAGEC